MANYNSQGGLTPVPDKVFQMCEDTITAIHKNFKTQAIFPNEVYPGYLKKNAAAKPGSWKSTGAAFDSFYFQVVDATEGKVRADFFYNYYMNFVDMGVGTGRPIDAVIRSYNLRNTMKYADWNPKKGETHRPAVSSEFRHLAGRMRMYFSIRFMMQAEFLIMRAFEPGKDE